MNIADFCRMARLALPWILFLCTAAVAQNAATKRDGIALDTIIGVGNRAAVVENLKEPIHRYAAPDAAMVNRFDTVAALDLAIPERAVRELEKGIKASQRGNFEKGRSHFLKAIGIFPQFSDAYNNLGVITLLKSDAVEAEDWFTRALRIDAKNPYALMNLAKLKLGQQDPGAAEQFARRFVELSPSNAEGLTVLAHAQLKLGKPEDAIATCIRVEASSHAGLAEIHLIASRAFESLGLPRQTIKELNEYLREGGSGDAAYDARVRQSIKQLENGLSGQK
jgi:tetratricopeptide (TPR) repeat protein